MVAHCPLSQSFYVKISFLLSLQFIPLTTFYWAVLLFFVLSFISMYTNAYPLTANNATKAASLHP